MGGFRRARLVTTALATVVLGFGMLPHGASASTNATATVTGAPSPTLVTASDTAPAFSATLTGLDQTVTAKASFGVSDSTGTGSGWNVTLSGGTLTDSAGTHTLPQPNTAAAATFVCDASSSCTLPTSNTGAGAVSYPLAVSTSPVKLYSAASGTGMGQMTGTNTWSLLIPANAAAGSYGATWTYSIVSGP